MNSEIIIQSLVERIIEIEHEHMESADAGNSEIRGKIVNAILAELDKAVSSDED